ncbi:MAG: ATP phosphoribosyltransferase regulatory subunit [Caulobacteraceae bacterium]|nr:MAG: ATP phosphoribosyltransferase regulatory subunit [Caulobacteraceae bacterium]
MRLERTVPKEALEAIRAPFAGAGTLLETPVLQPLALLLDLAGEAMRPRLFVVQAEGGEEAALRPDFTIPIARAHIAQSQQEGGVADGRYCYEGKAFRAAGGSARAEEFLQLGLEVYGGADAVAVDAEILSRAWKAAAAGGRSDLTLVLGDVSLFAALVEDMGLEPALAARLKRAFNRPRLLSAELNPVTGAQEAPQSRLAGLLGGLGESEAVALLEEVWSLAGVSPVGGRPTAEIARRLAGRGGEGARARLSEDQIGRVRAFLSIEDAPAIALGALAGLGGARLDARLGDWRRRLALLTEAGVSLEGARFGAGFGRAFGYYDGALFEVRSAALGADRPLAAGGRYDGLVTRLGGKASGAAGCMVRPARAFVGGGE